MERRKNTKERRKSVRVILEEHTREDTANFKAIRDQLAVQDNDHKVFTATLERIEAHMKTSNDFMGSLSWLSEISRGTQLLKRPSLWLVAFVVGLVALFGGLKGLAAMVLAAITPK